MTTICVRALISRRSTFLSILAVSCVCSAGELRAGVIVPWTQRAISQASAGEQFTGLIELAVAGAGSSSSVRLPIAEQPGQRDSDRRNHRIKSIPGLAETDGGASIPVSSTSGQVVSAPALLAAVPTVPACAKTFLYLRDRTPQLPQPPLGELLDPPKACA